jgi:peptidoglycan/xylan/chitin deacetylase (PgdA/CDA1 family)
VGVDRILRLLDRLKLRASFFIPGWTVEHHPAESRRIRDAGHEIGAHGNMHEALGFLDEAQEERVMREQLAILQSELGVRPAGYRSPSWDVNVWTPTLLKRHGFLYDSSLMGNDVPYEVETGQGGLVEVPVQWLLDDAPLFRHVYGATNAIADPGRVLQMWSKEFQAMHGENGCFVLTCHPFVSGRASRIALLEELVASMRRARGVWFATCEEVARWHASRPPAGAAPAPSRPASGARAAARGRGRR